MYGPLSHSIFCTRPFNCLSRYIKACNAFTFITEMLNIMKKFSSKKLICNLDIRLRYLHNLCFLFLIIFWLNWRITKLLFPFITRSYTNMWITSLISCEIFKDSHRKSYFEIGFDTSLLWKCCISEISAVKES